VPCPGVALEARTHEDAGEDDHGATEIQAGPESPSTKRGAGTEKEHEHSQARKEGLSSLAHVPIVTPSALSPLVQKVHNYAR